MEAHFKDGKWDGLWTFWDPNEKKEREAQWKDGKMDGLWTW